MTLHDAVLALHRERVAQCEQWSELFTALALAGGVEGTARTDLLTHAADLAHELTGDCEAFDGLFPDDTTIDDDRASAQRGRDLIRRLANALADDEGDDDD